MEAMQIFHVNINCSNLERSLEFYKRLGFKEVIDFSPDGEDGKDREEGEKELGEPQLGPALGLPSGAKARARLLMLGDNPRSARLDLIEWVDPREPGVPYETLTHLGIARFCMRVRDIEEAYQELVGAGGDPLSPPTLINLGGTRQRFFCARDPDGTVVEFMEFLKD